MTAQNVHLKPQTNGYPCKTPSEFDSDSGEPETLDLESRYVCVLTIMGFTQYVSYSLLCNKLPQSLIVACKHLLFHSFCGSESGRGLPSQCWLRVSHQVLHSRNLSGLTETRGFTYKVAYSHGFQLEAGVPFVTFSIGLFKQQLTLHKAVVQEKVTTMDVIVPFQ